MLITSFKVSKKLLWTSLFVVFSLILLLILAMPGAKSQDVVSKGINFKNIKTNEDRIAFLRQYGWEVNEQPVSVQEVTIPQTFDDVYTRYNKIQQKNGLDLTKYKGCRAKRWTYAVKNYPIDVGTQVYADILVCNDRVIGGDIATWNLNGFMHGFEYEK
ncbi:MAG: DUF4830 domain-containing protein [Bacillota bacterium]|nr:DUF4830 domain-containing protein [Bacillota bacterium]